MSHVAIDSQPRPVRRSADRRLTLSRLNQAVYDARRLASFRRALLAVLIALGTPVLILSRSTDPRIKHAPHRAAQPDAIDCDRRGQLSSSVAPVEVRIDL